MGDAPKRDERDPSTGLPDALPGGPDDEPGDDRPLVEDDDLDANDED